jgi:hypothetical protein
MIIGAVFIQYIIDYQRFMYNEDCMKLVISVKYKSNLWQRRYDRYPNISGTAMSFLLNDVFLLFHYKKNGLLVKPAGHLQYLYSLIIHSPYRSVSIYRLVHLPICWGHYLHSQYL